MPSKKVKIGGKPAGQEVDVEQWVENRTVNASEPVKMKRLTLDIPESLHRKIKMKAASEGVAMADLLRELLEKHFEK
ncbi:MAG: toxin-antitoxin system HicB family antitoxin [Prochloraceae cyanobacterium]|nr:toxin-antitoxin system HicB family antitoxin [Prochloraceae cyanobacterium]